MITKFLKRSSYGMTLLELTAGIVVMAIIGIGMTSGAQAVMLHYRLTQLDKIFANMGIIS